VLIGGERVRTAAQVRALNISWYYNYTPAATASGAEFVPMIRDESQLSRLNELAGTTGWVLGFNECGVENQATSLNTPLKIARAWRRVEQALPDAQLVSPSFVDQNSLPWAVGDYPTFAEFVAAYRAEYGESPRIDAISIHTYVGAQQAARCGTLAVRNGSPRRGGGAGLRCADLGHRVRIDPLAGQTIPPKIPNCCCASFCRGRWRSRGSRALPGFRRCRRQTGRIPSPRVTS
jgi:hypothetical protein